MGYELIICEKPKAAEKIAYALADSRPEKKSDKGVPYYYIQHEGKEIVVGAAVGHIYGLAESKDSNWNYPIFDIEWKPTSSISKSADYSKKYLNTLKKLAKDADTFTIATDYDVEGEVIGLNVLRFTCKQKDGRRMKFSTLTKPDIVKAYEKISKSIDWGQAKAGETRHKLDWYYGINLSRALTLAIKRAGMFKVLSAGRVQGPALYTLVEREKEIQAFKPEKFWEIHLDGAFGKEEVQAQHETEKFWEEKEADAVLEKTKDKPAIVNDVTAKQFKQQPPTPFDLTTLQTESYRCFSISPKDTLAIAQNLYTEGLISYPRTSSQKLPKEIQYTKILKELSTQIDYQESCEFLLKLPKLVPNEGKKSDPAHPAIYPTGQRHKGLTGRDLKVYDLVVRRFFAVFGQPAVRETVTVKIDVNKEIFITKGTRTVEKNWHNLYGKYATYKDEEVPGMKKGDSVDVKEIKRLDKETQPPKRYTQSSIIKELEKRNLGTKATRAAILENLYDRNYAAEKSITVTDLGMRTATILEKYAPRILDEKLTRKFEEEMDKIREGSIEPEDVLEQARVVLYDILKEFREHELEVGKALMESFKSTRDSENSVGKCPKCGEGVLKVMFSKKIKKRFVACNRYPDCKTIFQIPQTGRIKPLNKECKDCNHPMIQISQKRKPQQVCINADCPAKKSEAVAEDVKKECPKCGKDLVLRKSIYGQFLGCTGYPKCKHTEALAKK